MIWAIWAICFLSFSSLLQADLNDNGLKLWYKNVIYKEYKYICSYCQYKTQFTRSSNQILSFLLIDQSEPSLLEPANKSETAMPKSTFAAFYEEILDDFLMPIL